MKFYSKIFALTLSSLFLVSLTTLAQGDDTNKTVDGKKEGQWVIFAKMRNVKGYQPEDKFEEGKYKTDRKTGVWTRFYASGNKKSEITFANGRPSGDYTTYYDEEGKVEEQGAWKGRKNVGKFVRKYPNGQIARECNFNEKGKSDGKQVYYTKEGVEELVFTTSNGVETGTAIRRWPNGNIKEVITYDNDGTVAQIEKTERVDPPLVVEEPKGKDSEKVKGGSSNQDGVEQSHDFKIPDGERKIYNNNKDIWMDGEFKNGRLWNGKLYIYDEDGLIEKIEIYKGGKFAGTGVLE